MKICTKCGVAKPLEEFFARKGASDGKMSSCKQCKTDAIYAWREKNREHLNAYQRKYNSQPKAQAKRSAWRSNPENKERQRALEKERSKTDQYKERKRLAEKRPAVDAYRKMYRKLEDVKDRAKRYREQDHVKAATARRMRELRRSDPFERLNSRMSNAIGQAIRKGGRSWRSLVGYTCGDLMDHLEKQFTKGMGWHNYGEWHIDHIVPKASFTYETAEDPDFKECWSLSNLRPLWAKDNLSKSSKQVFLL